MDGQPVSFLTPEPALYHARAQGFAHFGLGHLVCLALALMFVVYATASYRHLPHEGADSPRGARLRMLRLLAGASVALITSKCLSYLALGLFEPLFWPLHVCNLCEFVALGYALAPRSPAGRRLGDLLFCWGLTGCLAALLLPGWSWYCPVWSFASISGFAEHALVLACACCVLVGGDYVPRPRRLWFVLLVTVVCGAVFRLLNPLLGTNFFFVTNPAAVGGPGPWLLATFGDPGFLVAYLLLTTGMWVVLYTLYRAFVRSEATTLGGDQ